MVKLLEIIRQLEGSASAGGTSYLQRRYREKVVKEGLDSLEIPYSIDKTFDLENIVIDIPAQEDSRDELYITSHYDAVQNSPGANDNGSGIAVCIELAKRLYRRPASGVNLKILFFDAEEERLAGSKAYVRNRDLTNVISIYNLDMVGRGSVFGVWGNTLDAAFKLITPLQKRIPLHSRYSAAIIPYLSKSDADHSTFAEKGVNAVSVIALTRLEYSWMQQYEEKTRGQSPEFTDQFIDTYIKTLPIFTNYHNENDTSAPLSSNTMNYLCNLMEGAVREY